MTNILFMLSIERDGKQVNVKRLGESGIQNLIIDVIKCNHPKKYEIVDYYFKKYKFKPHKILNDEMSFIECTLKYDFDMLIKYVPDIDIKAPGYNVINTCVMVGRVDLLKKYIKKKGQNLNEYINKQTPLIGAIKQKNKEMFDLLVNNGCRFTDVDEKGETPFSYVELGILEDLKNGVTSNNAFYLHAISTLLITTPTAIYEEVVDQANLHKSHYLDFLINENCPMNETLISLYANHELLLSLTTQTNLNFFGSYEHQYFSEIAEIPEGFEFAKEIMSRRPYLALRKYDKNVILCRLCAYSSPLFLDFLLDKYHLLISNFMEAVFSLLATESLKWIKHLFKIYPDLIKCKNDENKNIIEALLLTTDYEHHYVMECMEYFKSLGETFTYCDDEGSNPLSIAIQHGNLELFSYILQHHTPETIKAIFEKSKNKYMSCPMMQACHYGKLDYLKLLVKQGFPVIMTEEEINNGEIISFPACVPPVIFKNNHQILQYIIECPEFKIEKEQKEFIFEFAKANKCSNKILSMFDDSYEELEESIDPEIIKLNGLLASYFSHYRASLTRDKYDSNFRIISCLKTLLNVLLKLINSNSERCYKNSYFNKEIDSFKKYFNPNFDQLDMIYVILEYLEIDYDYHRLQSHILEPLLLNNNINNSIINTHKNDLIPYEEKFKTFGIMLDKLYKLLADCEIENYVEKSDENMCYCEGCGDYMGSSKKINVATSIIDTSGSNELYCQLVSTQPEIYKGLKQINVPISNTPSPSSIENDNNNMNELIRTYHTFNLEPKLIDQLLARVSYPFEATNYNLLRQMLSVEVTCTEQDNKYNIHDGLKQIATIYKNNKQNIPCWIEHYGYNICEKMDKNHMFPFGVDIIMHNLWNSGKIKCGYTTTETSKNIYIYGKVYMEDRWTRGYFEYFLNEKNILFHRLFKPLSKNHIYKQT